MTSTTSIPAVAGPSAAASAAAANTAAGAVDATSERFLTLLVTQLKNQDPLNPLDNAQITSQLAQLSTVSGINQLNGTLSALSASFDAKQYLEAANLVGRTVVADGNALTLTEGKASGAFELPAAADHVVVSVTDAAGQAVRQIDLGAANAGVVTFDWDGASDAGVALKDGKYTLSVTATNAGKPVAATPLAVGVVKGLIPGAGGGTLNIDGVGPIGLAAIRQIS
ncbi:MAG: flagellar hook assembly protein FlgD [Casimicrobiaceae bacterium]